MTDVDELLKSMQSAMLERPVPDFDDVVRRRRRATRRHVVRGTTPLLLAAAAGAGAYLVLPGTPASMGSARQVATATSGHAESQPTPELGDGVCSNVRITRPPDTGGRPDPVTAAQQFARGSSDGYPTAGWHVVYRAINVAQVESGAFDALTVRGADGTWQVLSAQRCD